MRLLSGVSVSEFNLPEVDLATALKRKLLLSEPYRVTNQFESGQSFC